MNKVYKIIWSNVRKCYVVVAEIAKNHGKNNVRTVFNRMAASVLGGVILAGLALTPSAWAQNIEKVSGAKFNDVVNHIYADKVVNSTAVNAFKTFELDQGRIANMYMGPEANPNAAGTLVNFVDHKINISGTVNAIKNGAIGGNLWFLSPDGMVVGASGVINAGSVHALAPTKSFYDSIVGKDGVKDTAFSQNWSNIQKGSIALNNEGTITVAGRINAVDGVELRAGKIEVNTGANIQNRDSLDYKDLVNIGTANAGLTGSLSLTKSDKSGKIVLAAKGLLENDATAQTLNLNPSVTVARGAKVVSDGDVSINSDASNKMNFLIANISSEVKIDGTVTGNNVDISAKADDTFKATRGDGISDLMKGGLTLGNFGSYNLINAAKDVLQVLDIDTTFAVHNVKAVVNIGRDSVITATGADAADKKALNISATSVLEGGMATSPDTLLGDMFDRINDRYIKVRQGAQSTSVAVGKLDNRATVNVEGKMKTEKGGSTIGSDAQINSTVSAKESPSLKTDNVTIGLGVGVLLGSNESEVNLKNSADLTEIAGGFKATAESKEKLSMTAGASVKGAAMAGTAVGIMSFNSAANLMVDTAIKAGGAVDLSSKNTVAQNKLNVSNAVGWSTVSTENTMKSLIDLNTYIGNVKNSLVDAVAGKFFGLSAPKKGESLFEEAKSLFNAGASVGVAEERNTAKTLLTKNASIVAGGNVKVTSAMENQSTHMVVSGSAGNAPQAGEGDNQESKQKVKVQASVLVADIESGAKVEIEDGTAESHASISGKDVTIGANSTFTHALDNLLTDFATIEKGIKDLSDTGISKDWNAL